MLTALTALLKRPEVNAPETSTLYRNLWEDGHISKGMLESHLNPEEDGATRKHEFVFKSAKWVGKTAPPAQFGKLIDLGCGPGIYAERFVKEGYSVTGIDYSARSIEYAKEQTALNGSGIEYIYKNYLTIDYEEQFDVVTLINKDYGVFSAADRETLLKKVFNALKPGGKFIFDVFSPKSRKKERRSWEYHESGGFFSGGAHLLLEAVHQYDDSDQTELDQYVVITNDNVKCFLCASHYFTKELLTAETKPFGFKTIEFYGDIAGKEYTGSDDTVCCVLTK